MRILCITLGSTGDILPFLNLSRELHARGHTCVLATQAAFADLAASYPVEFRPLFYSPELNRLEDMMLQFDTHKSGGRLVDYFYERIFRELAPAREQLLQMLDEADCTLASYLFPFFALMARQRGRAAHTVAFSHRFFPSDNHNPLLEKRRALPLNRLAWKLFYVTINRKMRKHLKQADMLSLIPEHYCLRREYVDHCFLCVPSVFEDNLGQPSPDSPFLGALRAAHTQESLPDDLSAFLAEGPVPLLNFGSVTFRDVEAVMDAFVREWPPQRRILVQTGWAGLQHANPPSTMRFIGSIPHQALLPHISTIIHHGGAGTTAAALHAGIPQVIIPHIADQWFMASEVERLGAGVELRRKNWPRNLPRVLARMEADPAIAKRARDLSSRLSSDSGIAALTDRLEQCQPSSAPPES